MRPTPKKSTSSSFPKSKVFPGARAWFVPKDPETGEAALPLGGVVAGARDDNVILAVVAAVGVPDAPKGMIRDTKTGNDIPVLFLQVPRTALREKPLVSWGADYLDFPSGISLDPFLLVQALGAEAGYETGAETADPEPPPVRSGVFPMRRPSGVPGSSQDAPRGARPQRPEFRPPETARPLSGASAALKGLWNQFVGGTTPQGTPSRRMPQQQPPEDDEGEEEEYDEEYEEEEEAGEATDAEDLLDGDAAWNHFNPEEEEKRRPYRHTNSNEARPYKAARRRTQNLQNEDRTLRLAVQEGQLSLSEYVQFENLSMLNQREATRGDAEEEKETRLGGSKLTRGLVGLQDYRRSIVLNPKRFLRDFDGSLEELAVLEEGEKSSYSRIGLRRIGWGKPRGLGRCYQMFGNLLKVMKQGHFSVAAAYCAASMMALHQVALDKGKWRKGWLPSGLPMTLYGKKKVAGTFRQLEQVAGYLEAEDKVTSLGKAETEDTEDEDTSSADEEAPRRRRPRKKKPAEEPTPKPKAKATPKKKG